MKHFISRLAAILLIVSPIVLTAQGKESSVTKLKMIERKLKVMEQTEHFSGVVLIAKKDHVLLHKAYGYANRADVVRNLPDTQFNMASMTKMFTGLAILQLVEAGKLSLHEKIARYIPDYSNRSVADSVTVHQLLTHTSGLGNFWEELDRVAKEKYTTIDDYITLFAEKPLLYPPGSQFQYSNAGYVVLGKIIEVTSGQSYDTYIERNILTPLGMKSTKPLQLDDTQPNVAIGYTMSLDNPGHWKNNIHTNVFKGGPAGGYYTTAHDLLRFSKGIQSNAILNKDLTQEYVTGKVRYAKGMYAYGISTDTWNGQGVFGHTGGHFGIANEFLVSPDIGYTIIIMTNGEVENYWEASNLIKSALLGPSPAANNYFFTREVIRTTIQSGEVAAKKLVDMNKKFTLRESVIDRWAFHALFDQKKESAIALLKLNVICFPKSGSARYSLAEGYRLTGDRHKSIQVFEQYLVLEPNDTVASQKLSQLKAGN